MLSTCRTSAEAVSRAFELRKWATQRGGLFAGAQRYVQHLAIRLASHSCARRRLLSAPMAVDRRVHYANNIVRAAWVRRQNTGRVLHAGASEELRMAAPVGVLDINLLWVGWNGGPTDLAILGGAVAFVRAALLLRRAVSEVDRFLPHHPSLVAEEVEQLPVDHHERLAVPSAWVDHILVVDYCTPAGGSVDVRVMFVAALPIPFVSWKS